MWSCSGSVTLLVSYVLILPKINYSPSLLLVFSYYGSILQRSILSNNLLFKVGFQEYFRKMDSSAMSPTVNWSKKTKPGLLPDLIASTCYMDRQFIRGPEHEPFRLESLWVQGLARFFFFPSLMMLRKQEILILLLNKSLLVLFFPSVSSVLLFAPLDGLRFFHCILPKGTCKNTPRLVHAPSLHSSAVPRASWQRAADAQRCPLPLRTPMYSGRQARLCVPATCLLTRSLFSLCC